jgi:HAE1 family hydrophobic/amphiphilic exporter-1
MTSIAFILGVFPLYVATGAGAYGRHSVGTAIIGGMALSTILNLFFIPVLYVILKTMLARFAKKKPTSPKGTELPPAQQPAR